MPSPLDVRSGCVEGLASGELCRVADAATQHRVANQRGADPRLAGAAAPGSRVAMEATGGYHRVLADLAHAQGMRVYVLNPCDLRHYARAVGIRGKTDKVDATVIARYLEREGGTLHCYLPPTPAQRQIDGLLRRRATVVASKTQLRLTCTASPAAPVSWAPCSSTWMPSSPRSTIAWSDSATVQAAAQQRVQSVLGIGPLVGVALTILFTRVPLRDGDAAVAFVGLDPRAKDSGQHTGRRRLSGRGPAELRRLLFNAARSASKTKLWRPLYERYRARGLSTTEATVILARKLLRVAFSIYRHGTTFKPDRFAHA